METKKKKSEREKAEKYSAKTQAINVGKKKRKGGRGVGGPCFWADALIILGPVGQLTVQESSFCLNVICR